MLQFLLCKNFSNYYKFAMKYKLWSQLRIYSQKTGGGGIRINDLFNSLKE